jgi:hypothetical protein
MVMGLLIRVVLHLSFSNLFMFAAPLLFQIFHATMYVVV